MSNPDWVAQILAMTTDELAERNGAGLLAQQLQAELRHEQRRIKCHADEVRAYMKANAGGLAVYWLAHEARRRGRKLLRVADILAAMESAQTLDLNSTVSVAVDKGAESYEHTLGGLTPVLDADGLPAVRTVGDLTARHLGKRVRTVECEGVLDFIGRERCRFECLLDLDGRPDPRTYGQWLTLDTPCEVLS